MTPSETIPPPGNFTATVTDTVAIAVAVAGAVAVAVAVTVAYTKDRAIVLAVSGHRPSLVSVGWFSISS